MCQLCSGLIGGFDGQGQAIGQTLLALDRTLEELDLGFRGTEARQEIELHVSHSILSVPGSEIAHAATSIKRPLNRENTWSTISDL